LDFFISNPECRMAAGEDTLIGMGDEVSFTAFVRVNGVVGVGGIVEGGGGKG
jgi:hypothetical protein